MLLLRLASVLAKKLTEDDYFSHEINEWKNAYELSINNLKWIDHEARSKYRHTCVINLCVCKKMAVIKCYYITEIWFKCIEITLYFLLSIGHHILSNRCKTVK